MRSRSAAVAALSIMMTLASCGGATEVEDTSPPTSGAVTTSTTLASTTQAPTTTTSVAATTTTEAPTTTTTTTVATTTSLTPVTQPIPEPTLGPPAGSVWVVVGVQYDDRLNVRAIPGVSGDIVGTLAPTHGDIEASGTAVLLGRSIWWEISSSEADGWVNARYLGAEGSTDDVTSAVVEDVGTIPFAPTMVGLAEIVVESRWLPLGTEGSFVIVGGPSVSDSIGEITIDVFPDESGDSVRGARLVVFGQQDGSTGPFSLMAVEETTICWRGADADGLCV